MQSPDADGDGPMMGLRMGVGVVMLVLLLGLRGTILSQFAIRAAPSTPTKPITAIIISVLGGFAAICVYYCEACPRSIAYKQRGIVEGLIWFNEIFLPQQSNEFPYLNNQVRERLQIPSEAIHAIVLHPRAGPLAFFPTPLKYSSTRRN